MKSSWNQEVTPAMWVFIAVGTLIVLSVVSSFMGLSEPKLSNDVDAETNPVVGSGEDVSVQTPKNSTSSKLSTGEKAITGNPKNKTGNCGSMTFATYTFDDYRDYDKALDENDNKTLSFYLREGFVFRLPECTSVEVISSRGRYYNVLVKSGEYAGEILWFRSEDVKRVETVE